MAQLERDAFSAGLSQLATAYAADDAAGGQLAALGLATLIFGQLDRIADALERIAKAQEAG